MKFSREEAIIRFPIGCTVNNGNLDIGANCTFKVKKHSFSKSSIGYVINGGCTDQGGSFTIWYKDKWAVNLDETYDIF